mmetsp:Transcript_79728/g.145509  ORF Transcript_79728/g.145509 Transcript_79728/m.145509 type:complete len:363 (-) Transcript_79728:163-1251(-)
MPTPSALMATMAPPMRTPQATYSSILPSFLRSPGGVAGVSVAAAGGAAGATDAEDTRELRMTTIMDPLNFCGMKSFAGRLADAGGGCGVAWRAAKRFSRSACRTAASGDRRGTERMKAWAPGCPRACQTAERSLTTSISSSADSAGAAAVEVDCDEADLCDTANQDDAIAVARAMCNTPMQSNSLCHEVPPCSTIVCSAPASGSSAAASGKPFATPALPEASSSAEAAPATSAAEASMKAASSARPFVALALLPSTSPSTRPWTAAPLMSSWAHRQSCRRMTYRSSLQSRPLSVKVERVCFSNRSSWDSTWASLARSAPSSLSGTKCASCLTPLIKPVQDAVTPLAIICGAVSSRPCAQQQT